MKLKQLSVFLENKPGRLRELCALLADNGINIITLSLADTEQFGSLPDKALSVSLTMGMRVEPPTISTWSRSSHSRPAACKV